MTETLRFRCLEALRASFAGMLDGHPPTDPYSLQFSSVEHGLLSDFDNRKRYVAAVVPGREIKQTRYPLTDCTLPVTIEFRMTIDRGDKRPLVEAERVLGEIQLEAGRVSVLPALAWAPGGPGRDWRTGRRPQPVWHISDSGGRPAASCLRRHSWPHQQTVAAASRDGAALSTAICEPRCVRLKSGAVQPASANKDVARAQFSLIGAGDGSRVEREHTNGESRMDALRLAVLGVSAVLLAACATIDSTPPTVNQLTVAGDIPANLMPMYGGPGVVKSEAQKRSDELFIEAVTKTAGSRKVGSNDFAGEGWRRYQGDDLDIAMRRFNQAWLLDPENFLPYWGFGAILMKLDKPEEAIAHYERSLSLIDVVSEKPRLLNDCAKAYSAAASKGGPDTAAWRLKSETLFQQAVQLDPKYSNAYRDWLVSNLSHQDYAKAWAVVKRAREASIQDLPQGLINALTEKMPEPPQ